MAALGPERVASGLAAEAQTGPLAVQWLRQSPTKVPAADAAHAAPFRTVVACVVFTPSAGEVAGLTARRVLHESPTHRSGFAAYAQQQDADLIVLATARRTPAESGLLGSTAERLVRELPCSVLVVRPPPDGPGVPEPTNQPVRPGRLELRFGNRQDEA